MKLFFAIAGLTILAACGPPTAFEDGTLLETRNTTPQTADTTDDLMVTAEDEAALSQQWENFRFPGSPPDVDMDENYVLFLKTGENSCEKEVEEIVTEDNSLRIDVDQEDRDCDDLYRPRSIAVEVERELAEELEQVLFDGESFQLEN